MKFMIGDKLYTELELHDFALDVQDRAEYAETQRDELAAELDAARIAAGIERGMPLDEWIIAIRNDHADMLNKRDALAAQLAAVTKERNRFADELAARGYKPRCTCTMDDGMHEPSCNLTEWTRLRFERTAPIDWRDAYDGETPLGIALDDSGDVEP